MAAKSSVGLDIGTSGVRAAEVSVSRAHAKLERFGQVALPSGAVRDGEVVDPATVAKAIKHLWATAKISSKKVTLGVANQKVIVRQLDLPWLPADELRQSLAIHVQDLIPMPVEQAVLDFHPVEEVTGENGARMLRVLLVAAARDMLLSALEAAKLAGLTVQQVELTPFAVLRSVGNVDSYAPAGVRAEALVDIGATVTNIIVHQNGVPRFVRVLLMGGDTLTEAVASRMGVPFDQAEATKSQMRLTSGVTDLSDHPAARALEGAAATFVDEVRGSLDYYLAQPTAAVIERLVVSGGGSRLSGMVERLATATRLPVEIARPLGRLTIGKTGLSPEQLQYVEPFTTVPVGLAMGVAS